MEHWAEVGLFHAKRKMDEQKARARDQFAPSGPGIPDNPEDPEPTRMTKPVPYLVTEARTKVA